MKVIECRCGMVMSLAAQAPRRSCIRCGGIEFRVVENAMWKVLSNGGATLSEVGVSSVDDAATFREAEMSIAEVSCGGSHI